MTAQQNKYIKIGIGATVVGAILYFLFKGDGTNGATEDPTGNGGVINPNQPSGFNASKIANDLYEVMKTTGFASWISGNGDERDILYNALKNISSSQFAQVVTAFGKKPYNPLWGGTYFALWSTVENHTLPFILKKELLTADYNLLKQKYPNSL